MNTQLLVPQNKVGLGREGKDNNNRKTDKKEKEREKDGRKGQCNPTSGSGEDDVYAALPLPCEGREVVSYRPLHQIKHIKINKRRK